MLIFFAVVSAFALTNWKDNKNSRLSEQKNLTEIKNGISIDKKDFDVNIHGHNLSLKANDVIRGLLKGKNTTRFNRTFVNFTFHMQTR